MGKNRERGREGGGGRQGGRPGSRAVISMDPKKQLIGLKETNWIGLPRSVCGLRSGDKAPGPALKVDPVFSLHATCTTCTTRRSQRHHTHTHPGEGP